MEDNRDKFIVILAGYRHDMKRLLDSNEGLKSRIKEYFNFPDYTVEEMKQIFVRMANTENFVVSEEALVNFEIRCQKEKTLHPLEMGAQSEISLTKRLTVMRSTMKKENLLAVL